MPVVTRLCRVTAKTVIPILIGNKNPINNTCSYKTHDGSWKCNLFHFRSEVTEYEKNKFKQWRHLVLLSYQGYKKSISKKTDFFITVIIWHAPKIPRFFVCQNLVSAKTVVPILIRNNNPMKEICSYKTHEGSWKCNLFQASVRSYRIRKNKLKQLAASCVVELSRI